MYSRKLRAKSRLIAIEDEIKESDVVGLGLSIKLATLITLL